MSGNCLTGVIDVRLCSNRVCARFFILCKRDFEANRCQGEKSMETRNRFLSLLALQEFRKTDRVRTVGNHFAKHRFEQLLLNP